MSVDKSDDKTFDTVIRILSYNCRGLSDFKKRHNVFSYLKDMNCHISCLQDVHFSSAIENTVKSQWDGKSFFSAYTSNARGVCILFQKGSDVKIHKEITDTDGNFLILDVEMNNFRFNLLNLYGPNNDSPDFYTKLVRHIETLSCTTNIICGDFNLIQEPDLDMDKYKNINNPRARKKVLEIKDTYNLTDPFRKLYPNLKRYTWRRSKPLKQSRLDFFLISDSIFNQVCKVQIEPSYRSDHSMVILSLKPNNFVKGRGLWKFNANLLRDQVFIDKIKRCIKDTVKQYMVPLYNLDNLNNIDNIQFTISDQLFLETLLMEIRGKCIAHSSFIKKEKNKVETNLKNQILKLENKNNLNQEDLSVLQDLKENLETVRNEKLKGSIIRSRVQWIEEGEKPNKYFLNLENHNFENKTISRLIDKSGNEITNQKEILNEVKSFYAKL